MPQLFQLNNQKGNSFSVLCKCWLWKLNKTGILPLSMVSYLCYQTKAAWNETIRYFTENDILRKCLPIGKSVAGDSVYYSWNSLYTNYHFSFYQLQSYSMAEAETIRNCSLPMVKSNMSTRCSCIYAVNQWVDYIWNCADKMICIDFHVIIRPIDFSELESEPPLKVNHEWLITSNQFIRMSLWPKFSGKFYV